MNQKKNRVPYLVGLHVLIFGLLSAAGPSAELPDPSSWQNAPTAEEIALYEELIQWIDATEPTDQSLRQAIRESVSFELFRSFHDPETRYKLLEEIPYGDRIRSVADRHGIDGLLIASVVEAESAFDPQAISRRGAIGLMQLMPTTAAFDPQQLTEPSLNLDLGARYLRYLLARYQGDLELALAAYNAGPTNVSRYGGLPPFRETRNFVDKVLRLYVDHHRAVWQTTELGEFLAAG